MSPAQRRRTLAAAIAAISTVGVGLSLAIPLLSLRMEQAGYSAGAIGVQTAFGAIATLICAPFVPRMAQVFGVRPLMLAALALGMACLLGFGLASDLRWWFPLRFAFGAALTALFVMSEYWINAAAPQSRRGLVMGAYATALALGFALGPALLSFSGSQGLLPFLIGCALLAGAAGPILLAGVDAPQIERRGRTPLLAFLTAAPIATLAAFAFGCVETGGMSLLPVYALRRGFTPQEAALSVSLFAVSSVALELPMGWLSDRLDRRLVLLGVGAVGCLGAAVAPLASGAFAAFAIVLAAWGGVIGGLYPLGLAHLGSRHQGAELAMANAAFVMFYSSGMLVGPPLLGAAMDFWSPHGLFAAMAAVLGGYVIVVLQRLSQSQDAKLS